MIKTTQILWLFVAQFFFNFYLNFYLLARWLFGYKGNSAGVIRGVNSASFHRITPQISQLWQNYPHLKVFYLNYSGFRYNYPNYTD